MRPVSSPKRSGALLIGIALVAYLAIGLPDGMLGVAWPTIADEFGVEVFSLGLLLFVLTSGYGIGAAFSGRLLLRFGPGSVVTLSAAASAIGVLGYTVAPNWSAMLGCALITGFGVGTMDGGLNSYAALRFSSAVTNWIHGFYALGASIGPGVMTLILLAGDGWRIGYLAAGSMLASVTIAFLFTRSRWRIDDDDLDATQPRIPAATSRSTLKLRRAWLGIGMFMVYAGLEVSAGQWTFTVLTEGRGVATEIAGASTVAYYVGLTLGRIGIGSLTAVFPVDKVLLYSIVSSVIAAAVFWLDFHLWIGFFAIFIMGLSFGPVFPSLISSTLARVGRPHTPNTVGFQVTGAAVGAMLLPVTLGFVAKEAGLATIPLMIFIVTVALLALFIIMEKATRARAT